MASYGIGPFRLDGEARMLFKGDDPVTLGKRAVALLWILIERRGQPVSKAMLIDAAWHGRSVEDNNLVVQIAALRRALGAAEGGAGWIETLPGRGYRFIGPVHPPDAGAAATQPPTVAAGPIPIAVLPLRSPLGDPEQDHLAHGITEEILTALSRFRSMGVVAATSRTLDSGGSRDPREIGRALGVRYLLDGNVRRSQARMRATLRLVDALSGAQLWAERYDGGIQAGFEVQDDIAGHVTGEIEPRLLQAERARSQGKPDETLGAWDCYLRAAANAFLTTRRQSDDVLALVHRAIALEPGFAAAYGLAAWYHTQRAANQWTDDTPRERAEALRLARRAAELGREDAFALAWAAYVLVFVGRDPEHGAALAERAVELNPNLALAWGVAGWMALVLGQPDTAIERTSRAMRLSPLDPFLRGWQCLLAIAHFLAGRPVEALAWTARALQPDPDFAMPWRIAAACHVLVGNADLGRAAGARLRVLEPQLRLGNFGDLTAPLQPSDVAKWQDGLRQAGLPD